MSGYVRIHRTLIGHPAFRNDAEAMAFAWLVAKAAWKPTRVRYKERAISLDRGQVAVSVRDFAAAMDRDKAWIERLLKRLKSETMVEVRHETGVNVITICKYATFQDSRDRPKTQGETSDETGARQGRDTEQEREEVKKEISSDEDSPSGDGLTPDHFFEAYQDLARELGLPVPRDFTPERRQLARGRVAQYSLADFQDVFARIRGSPFLRGDKGRTPLSIDWILKKSNFQKTLEGNYDG